MRSHRWNSKIVKKKLLNVQLLLKRETESIKLTRTRTAASQDWGLNIIPKMIIISIQLQSTLQIVAKYT